MLGWSNYGSIVSWKKVAAFHCCPQYASSSSLWLRGELELLACITHALPMSSCCLHIYQSSCGTYTRAPVSAHVSFGVLPLITSSLLGFLGRTSVTSTKLPHGVFHHSVWTSIVKHPSSWPLPSGAFCTLTILGRTFFFNESNYTR